MESSSSRPASLSALVHAPIHLSDSPYSKNTPSFLAPLADNLFFQPSLSDETFSSWHACVIKSIKDLYADKIFSSFQQLSDKFNLPRRDFFRYLQIRSFARKHTLIFLTYQQLLLLTPF
ncbi:hypothetical protein F7725_000404 [Dissostichus mawsoni]|uniref:Uncharacterized protein n=1 Tax=Dissostichus mawsoni TaxID=36200 RepID=A0A7J5ZGN6_DISMA|nr:hypothetical protein F7725_000404 [Dissostichus mawsoni]